MHGEGEENTGAYLNARREIRIRRQISGLFVLSAIDVGYIRRGHFVTPGKWIHVLVF
jgi:hypothetical protein